MLLWKDWTAVRSALSMSGLLVAVLLTASNGQAAPRRAVKGRSQHANDLVESVPFAPDRFLENLFGKLSDDDAAALADIEISLDEERTLGDAAVAAYLDQLRLQKLIVSDRGREVEYLRDLVDTLRPQMNNGGRYKKIAIYLVDDPATDARSFPGGTLVFFRGLIDFAETEAALAGIVGHELSHLDRGHQLGPLRRMKYFEQTVSGGAQSPQQMMAAMSAMLNGFMRPFHPEDESQADRDGANWAFRAGYDSREMALLFVKLSDRDKSQRAAQLSFFRTHPFHLDRARAIEAEFAALRRKSGDKKLYIGRQNLQQRTARCQREFAE